MVRLLNKEQFTDAIAFADRYVPAPTDDPEAFAMVVDGDCMAPDYRQGDVVVFSPLEVLRFGPQSGKDYAIQLKGQTPDESGFKRLFLSDEEPGTFVFRCANPKYSVSDRIAGDRIARLARAIWVSRPYPAYIERHGDFRGGRARVKGTRITVDDIVILHRHLGHPVEDISNKYALAPAAVHAALAYYFEHKDEIDRLIAADDAFVEAFQRNNPSRLQEKLKALGRG